MGKKVTAQIVTRSPSIFSEIDNNRVGPCEELHRDTKHLFRLTEEIEPPQFKVSDSTIDPFKLGEACMFFHPDTIVAYRMMEIAFRFFTDIAGFNCPERIMVVMCYSLQICSHSLPKRSGIHKRIINTSRTSLSKFICKYLSLFSNDIFVFDKTVNPLQDALLVRPVGETLLLLSLNQGLTSTHC